MQAPEKIYLQYGYYPAADTEIINSDWTDHPVQDYDNIAYIRKDAILEWAKRMLVCFKPGFDCHEILKEVINHIESL